MSINSTLILNLGREIGIIYIGIFIGYLFGQSRYYSKSFAKRLSKISVYILYPPIIIMNTLDIGEGQITEMLGIFVFSIIFHIFLLFLAILLMRNNRPLEKGSNILTATFSNAVTYPFPIIAAVIGFSGWIPATIFAIGSLIIMATAGGAVALNFSHTSGKSPNFFKNLIKLFKFPFFLAIIAALILRSLIGSINTNQFLPFLTWKYLGIIVGLILIGIDSKNLTITIIRKTGFNLTSTIRFIISPIIAIVSCLFLQLPRIFAIPLIIQAWAPPAIMTILYSEFFELDTQTTSRDVMLLTFIALLFLPIELFFLMWLYPA